MSTAVPPLVADTSTCVCPFVLNSTFGKLRVSKPPRFTDWMELGWMIEGVAALEPAGGPGPWGAHLRGGLPPGGLTSRRGSPPGGSTSGRFTSRRGLPPGGSPPGGAHLQGGSPSGRFTARRGSPPVGGSPPGGLTSTRAHFQEGLISRGHSPPGGAHLQSTSLGPRPSLPACSQGD